MKSWKVIVLGILIVIVAGCAINNRTFGTRNIAFTEGQALIAQGQFEDGLAKLEQALREEPENKEIRTILVRSREEVINKLLIDADNKKAAGDLYNAKEAYQRVISLWPFNERAIAGLGAIELDRRHVDTVIAAKEIMVKGDVVRAEAIVRSVLQENPNQSHARQLMKHIHAQMARAEVNDLALETSFKKTLTVEFKDTDLKSIFEIIARTAGVNFVFDKDVRQDAKVSIFIRDNTIDDVLKLLFTTNQLTYKQLNNNTLLIYPNTPAKLKDYQELVVRSFHVAHTDVKQMVAMIRGIVKAKDIYVNEQLNLFIMRDTLEAIRLTEKLVTLNDLAESEVMLDVVILEVSRNNNFLLGPNVPQSATFLGVAGAAAGAPAAAALINQIGFDGLKSFSINNQARIDFLHNITQGDILANPRIRVNNREKAKIHVGTKQPFFTANVQPGINSIVTSTPTFIDLGVKLDVEPRIGLNDDITLKITLEVSSQIGTASGPGGASAPVVGTRNAETILTIKDGETQVLAGLIENRETRSAKGIAGLLNIPGLDRLSSNQDVKRDKNEVVLLITPRVIRNVQRPVNLESEYHFGTASEAGKLPVNIKRTDAQSLAIAPAGSGQGGFARGGLNAFASQAEAPASPNPFADAIASAVPSLSLQAPSNVGLDKEFSVNVRLVGAKPTVNAELQLSYEASALEALDSGEKSGTRTIKLGKDQPSGMAAQLRFKVIAANPGATEINIQAITAEDSVTSEAVEVNLPQTSVINLK